MGGKPVSSSDAEKSQAGLADQMAASGKQSAAEGKTLFDLALPGLTQSESYYNKLASGDPNALARANAPAVGAITKSSDSAAKNIVQDNPRGGERNLALEENQINKGAQIGQLETGSYTNSFGSLASLGGQNVGQGTSATSAGLQGMNAAANQYGNIQQINAQNKSQTMGEYSQLAGMGLTVAGMCWVARLLFGTNSYEAAIIQAYFEEVLKTHWFGRFAYWTYHTFGKQWATFIVSHERCKYATLILFTEIYYRARKALPDYRRFALLSECWSYVQEGV